jgi:hypothetical protein
MNREFQEHIECIVSYIVPNRINEALQDDHRERPRLGAKLLTKLQRGQVFMRHVVLNRNTN